MLHRAGWAPVATVFSSLAAPGDGGEEEGFLVEWPNEFSEKVVADFGDDLRAVHVPWADRFAGFATLLAANTFCLSVSTRGATPQSYTLWVNELRFETEMREWGRAEGEMHIGGFLRRADVRLPVATPVAASAEWLSDVEDCVRSGDNSIEYGRCVPIGVTGWGYDLVREHVAPAGPKLKARFVGGLLSGGSQKIDNIVGLTSLVPRQGELSNMESRATLILTSPARAECWLERCAGRKAFLSGARDARGMTAASLRDYDVVVTTFPFLRSKAYVEALDACVQARVGPMEKRLSREPAAVRTCARVLRQMGGGDGFPLLELIGWHRLVVDELCTCIGESAPARERARILQNFTAGCVWGLVDDRPPDAALRFVLVPKVCNAEPAHPCLHHQVAAHLLGTCGSAFNYNRVLVQPTPREETAHRLNMGLSHAARLRLCSLPGAWQGVEVVTRAAAGLLYEETTCPVCLDAGASVFAQCGHACCARCMHRVVNCPSCRAPIQRLFEVSDEPALLFGSKAIAVATLAGGMEDACVLVQYPRLAECISVIAPGLEVVSSLHGVVARKNIIVAHYSDIPENLIFGPQTTLHFVMMAGTVEETEFGRYCRPTLGR